MKTIDEITESFTDKYNKRHFHAEDKVSFTTSQLTIIDSMIIEASKQAFEAGRALIPNTDLNDPDTVFDAKYKTFDEYFKLFNK